MNKTEKELAEALNWDYCDGCEDLIENNGFFVCNLSYWDGGRPVSGHSLKRPQKCLEDDSERYKITKKQCRDSISGVCPGCGGKVTPIKTVNNSDEPTFWSGCERCGRFCHGIEKVYFEIARDLVEKDILRPLHSLSPSGDDDAVDREYYLSTQTSNLSPIIEQIDNSLKEKRRIR